MNKLAMKNKGNGRLFLNSIVLMFSLLTMAVVTFAWFTTTTPTVDKVVLNSGNGAVTIDAYSYKQGYTNDVAGYPVPLAYNKDVGTELLNATKGTVDNEGVFSVIFSSETLSGFSYAGLYDNETSISDANFPHLYVELRYTKPTLDGFVKATVSDFSNAADQSGFINITSALSFEYRFTTVQNTQEVMYANGLKAAYSNSDYVGSSWLPFSTTMADFSLYNNTSDLSGYAHGDQLSLEDQCYVPGFPYKSGSNYLYSKSTLLEIRVNPLSWLSYFRNHPNAHASRMNFGIGLKIRADFSNSAFLSASQEPLLTVSSSSLNLAINSSASLTLANYRFSATPTYSVETNSSAIATGALSGSSLTINSGQSAGSALITITATNGSEIAKAYVAVSVFNGPTLLIDPNSLDLFVGDYFNVTLTTYLFDNTPTYSYSASTSGIVSVSFSNGKAVVTGLDHGTTTLTLNAISGSQSAYAQCQVSVTSAAKTITSIAVTALPSKTTYLIGQPFLSSGLVVTATFDDGTTAEATGYTLSLANGAALTTPGTQTITVSLSGKTTSFSLTVKDAYVLVTSSDQLVSGAHYLIASSMSTGSAYALSTTQYTNYRGRTSVSVATQDSLQYIVPTSTTEIVTLGVSSYGWTFYANRTTGYLSGVSSYTYLRTETTLSSLASWTISINASNYVATIANAQQTSYYLRYLASSSAYSAYRSSNNAANPYLFVRASEV